MNDIWYVKSEMGIRSSGYANKYRGDEDGIKIFGEWKQKSKERRNEGVGCLFMLSFCLSVCFYDVDDSAGENSLGGSIGKGGQRNGGR